MNCVRGSIGNGFQFEAACVVATNLQSESVIEAEIGAYFKVKARLVLTGDGFENLLRILRRRQFQNCGKGGAGVLGVNIDASGENGLVTDIGARQVKTAFDREVGFAFDLLSDDFA